ncbi:molybdopterin-binding protein [Novosphingobium sp. Gsoil 351]|uniref:molybdopterin-binding protein n=1 Tax=Novosphingobium sp. Gsoil 351 TaxID=2675225 RepID=UPI0012B46D94|nr:molybdopterin-binding protein [Novosphingobium sp. Gsoil 351]QGN53653.1 molybdopterin-dependent oxidoreductase [Novosphingobium sp. Gsoil 351]
MIGRRGLVASLLGGLVAGCTKVAQSGPGASLLATVEDWNLSIQRSLTKRTALAREFSVEDISPAFRGNGTIAPSTPAYAAHLANAFADWRLAVDGLVERPLSLSLTQLHALPQRTQITRHDCVEGWSAIGQWTGVPLGNLLRAAGLRPEAKFIVFHCADVLSGTKYYESIDLIDALHPQTIVAHALNGEPLPVKNGAPLRMRIERQLGYKQAKYVERIEAVASLQGIAGGKGGYWEDRSGYQWYAGI